jgi:hypothetical protein
VIGPSGTFGGAVNVSAFPDGAITVTIVETGGGKPTKTVTGTLLKNSVPPTTPNGTASTYANMFTEGAYNVTVTGQAGSIANVVITDSNGTSVADVANGMDFVGSNGTVVVPVDVTGLVDGPMTISVTLTNGAGDSAAYTFTETKAATPPPLTVTLPPYINASNAGNFNFSATGEAQQTIAWSFTDANNKTVSGSKWFNGNGSWATATSLSSLADGNITFTLTETDYAGNTTVYTTTLVKKTTPPAAATITLAAGSDTGASSVDWITGNNHPVLTASSTSSPTTTVLYVNGTPYTGQVLADGKYTVTATTTDNFGNQSTTTASKQLVIDTAPPTGSFTVSGGKTIGGQLTTNSKTPVLSLSYSDLAGVSSMVISVNGVAGASQAYSASPSVSLAYGDGIYTITVAVTDLAGNTTTQSLTVRLDSTPPTITASLSPAQGTVVAGSYDGTANITATAGATDISGATITAMTLDGAAFTGSTINIYTLAAGVSHSLVITATDGVGNAASLTKTFTIDPSLVGVEDLVKAGYTSGSLSSTIETALLAYLTNTTNPVKTDLTNFMNAVTADVKAKTISSAEGTLLNSWAQDLYNHS